MAERDQLAADLDQAVTNGAMIGENGLIDPTWLEKAQRLEALSATLASYHLTRRTGGLQPGSASTHSNTGKTYKFKVH